MLARYVREQGLLTWEEAIRKMTSAPAAVLGLRDRGTLRVGACADVVVLDAATVADRATSPIRTARRSASTRSG